MSATSPPTSPLPKRVKPNHPVMATAEPTPVTRVDAAPPLLIKKLSDKATLPTRGSAFAAGYDIYAAKDTVVPARGKVLVDTDISMAVPAGTCMYS
jgi:dUTP pyrophosphatase